MTKNDKSPPTKPTKKIVASWMPVQVIESLDTLATAMKHALPDEVRHAVARHLASPPTPPAPGEEKGDAQSNRRVGLALCNVALPIEIYVPLMQMSATNRRTISDELSHAIMRHLAQPPVLMVPELAPAKAERSRCRPSTKE